MNLRVYITAGVALASFAAAVSAQAGTPRPSGEIATANSVTLARATVVEPAAWTLMLVGFGGMGAALRSGRRPLPAGG